MGPSRISASFDFGKPPAVPEHSSGPTIPEGTQTHERPVHAVSDPSLSPRRGGSMRAFWLDARLRATSARRVQGSKFTDLLIYPIRFGNRSRPSDSEDPECRPQ